MQKLYTPEAAAKYLGLTLDGLKYHLYQSHRLEPDLRLGHSIAFFKETLDHFAHRHLSQDYTLDEAAAYLGVSRSRMRAHVYDLQTLKATGRRGRFYTFSQAALDAARPLITVDARSKNLSPASPHFISGQA